MNKKAVKLFIRIALSLGALYIIINKVDLPTAWSYLQNASPWYIILAFLSFLSSKVFAAFRINQLYKSQDLHLKESQNLKLSFLGMFYNLFIPLVGGEGYKAYWIKKRSDIPLKKLVWAALLDRASGLVGLVFITAIFFYWSDFEIEYKNYFIILVPLSYISHRIVTHFFFKAYMSAWISTQALSIIVQALQASTTYFVILALNIDQGIVDYIFVFMLASFAFVLPLVGAREMAFVFGANYLGLNMELSLAIGLLFYLCLAANSLIGSYFILNPKSLGEEVMLKIKT